MKETPILERIPEYLVRRYVDWRYREEINSRKFNRNKRTNTLNSKIPLDPA